ncbi:hypothetical protein E2C01_079412 [Portunus trituberculatus]|uniref:Uncharacterized protein n=1 Tax=Portunus trituberculatus TaxID=210409 RepID=A0A5B7ITB2_PORTR|nr:hypothetical protein [Portunus trituberculatus]
MAAAAHGTTTHKGELRKLIHTFIVQGCHVSWRRSWPYLTTPCWFQTHSTTHTPVHKAPPAWTPRRKRKEEINSAHSSPSVLCEAWTVERVPLYLFLDPAATATSMPPRGSFI